jgi:hypothetical protein
VPIASVQNRYSFVDRESDFIVDYCEENEIAFLPWAPIGQAKAAHEVLRQVAHQFYATPIQIALAWLLRRSRVIVPIPGTASVAHLEENIFASMLELSQRAFETLSEVRPSLRKLARLRGTDMNDTWLSFRSEVQVRTKERRAACVVQQTPKAGVPFTLQTEPLRMIEPPSFMRGRAFCTGTAFL